MPEELIGKQLRLAQYDTFGRPVGYHTDKHGQEELFEWLRINPHRFNLGRIGLEMRLKNGQPVGHDDLQACSQVLDLWNGISHSKFMVEETPVVVTTACHPHQDTLLVSIKSSLVGKRRLQVKIAFPYGSHRMNGADWDSEEKHKTITINQGSNFVQWVRILDDDRYYCTLCSSSNHSVQQTKMHEYCLISNEQDKLDFSCMFSEYKTRSDIAGYQEGIHACRQYWPSFWSTGGAIELAKSRDTRALELERRIVLSQYLTAIQCSGIYPPQETGLTCNSWYGKAHLEMHWWHAAHFPIWGRGKLLENSLWWYDAVMAKAKLHAINQGYTGVRWPKMVGISGTDSPSSVGPLLIWQQPHIIVFAELMYRQSPTKDILDRYREVVFETAEFMVDFAHYDSKTDRFILGSPLIPAQENHKPSVTLNPTYELEYWIYGLTIAQQWRERLGLPLNEKWTRVMQKLASPAVKDGMYLAHEHCPNTITEFNRDHPSMLCAFGLLPGYRIDESVMRTTLHKVLDCWQWDKAWGWDFPVVAMTAARVGEPELAIDALFIDSVKNTWLDNGHNYQRPNLPLYLPGNGALLLAVAMMARGWHNGPQNHAPGFPDDGSWKVEWEGLYKLN